MQRARSLCNTSSADAASFKIPARYKFTKLLGSGSYGVVASFYDAGRGRDVAIKRVRRVFDNFLVLRRTLREIRLMRHFRHPNVLRLHKVLPLEGSNGDLYLSLELMDCDLDTLIHGRHVALTDHQVRRFTAQMLLGLLHLHGGHVLHRDLKPANIFVRLSRGQVKIGDLGLSRGVEIDDETNEATHPSDELLTEYVVTRWYRAPEVLLARSKYGPPVDVWSVGCILYEMWVRKALFPGKNSYDQLRRVMAVLGTPSDVDCEWVPPESLPLLQRCCQPSSSEGDGAAGAPSGQPRSSVAWSGLPSAATAIPSGLDLLKRMCAFDPNRRVAIEHALQLPYLQGFVTREDVEVAKAVVPADVAYDRMFDGIGRSGESAALLQLGRMLRREVAKDARPDATPDHSPSRSPRDTKAVGKPYGTPRGSIAAEEPMHVAAAAMHAAVAAAPGPETSTYRSTRGSSASRGHGATAPTAPQLGSAGQPPRRSSEGDVSPSKGRRAVGTGGALLSRTSSATAAAAAQQVKRRASEPVPAAAEQPPPAFYELATAEARRDRGREGAPHPSLLNLEDSGERQQHSSRLVVDSSVPTLRRRCDSSSRTGGENSSTRGPSGSVSSSLSAAALSGNGEETRVRAAPRASSRQSRSQSARQQLLAQRADQAHEGSYYLGPAGAAAASSPRASAPILPFEAPVPRGGKAGGIHDPSPTATTRTPGSSKPASAQSGHSFFEPHSGPHSTNSRTGPAPPWHEPSLSSSLVAQNSEDASAPCLRAVPSKSGRATLGAESEATRMASLLDEMIRSASARDVREETSPRTDRPRKVVPASARGASGQRTAMPLSSSRGAGSRSVSSKSLRASDASAERRQWSSTSGGFQHDELDFAVCEPQVQIKRQTTPRRSATGGVSHHPYGAAQQGAASQRGCDDSPTPPWLESWRGRKQSPEADHSPAPAVPWASSSSSRRKGCGATSSGDLVEVARQLRTWQSNLEAPGIGAGGSSSVPRGGTPPRRGAASHMRDQNGGGSGLGYAA